MNKYWKILIPLLLALALGLGLFQHNRDPYLGSNKTSYNFVATDKSLEGYYNEAAEMAKNSNSRTELSFLALGDIMLSRNVAAEIEKTKNPNTPFLQMANLLKETDFAFGNLETPILEKGGIVGGHSLIFAGKKDYLSGLVENKFKILNLANNHALDQGVKGLASTINYLDEAQIKHIGAGLNQTDAWAPAVIEQNGMKICFLGAAYSSINDGGKTTNDYVARVDDIKNLKLKIENSKSLCDFVVISMHAGAEYTHTPNQIQIDFAHTAIDAGADMVIGHHPHWIQTIEKYNDKYIFYSLGNFIFDQMWSQDTREGLALKINLSKNLTANLQGPKISATLDKIELIPIIIENYSTPRPATEVEAKKILEKIDINETTLH